MSFKATLSFSGKDYDVLHCSYSLYRDVDMKGRPTSGVYGGRIEVEVESNDDTSIIEKMVNNQFKPVDGTLTIKKRDEDAKMKEISFKEAYIVNYSESIHAYSDSPMTLQFQLSAKQIKIGNADHENDWPK
uniref:Type VI secretion system needle protein Hcp n=1 Tax=Sphingobacterium sp. (strain 21) TaxID=743722 RepID=F4C6C4_SPHS2